MNPRQLQTEGSDKYAKAPLFGARRHPFTIRNLPAITRKHLASSELDISPEMYVALIRGKMRLNVGSTCSRWPKAKL